MKKLLRYLSPFAPDQSGACGVLYELGGLIVICDAGGCSGNICGFDEPRWFTKKSAIFSAGLRDMDAIMGRDDKLIEKLAKAQEALKGSFTALIATPVPAVIGTDMKALKKVAEKKLGVPCIAINAIGTRYYDAGEEEAWLQVFKEFAKGDDSVSEAADGRGYKGADGKGYKAADGQGYTGIIGATPLETGYSTDKPLADYCEQYGISNPLIFGMGNGLEDINKAPACSKNIVVSVAGLKAARYLEKEYGIPYEAAFPFIPDTVKKSVSAALDSYFSENIEKQSENSLRILIIHTQFAANELRHYIQNELSKQKYISASRITIDASVTCATFFMQAADYAEEGDFTLSGEDELFDRLQEADYDILIADGDIERLARAAGYKGSFVKYDHFAISGNMNDDSILFFS